MEQCSLKTYLEKWPDAGIDSIELQVEPQVDRLF